MSYKAETLTISLSLSLSFLICVNGMLSRGLAFCSSELPIISYKKGIKVYRCKYVTTGSYPRTNNHASTHVKRTLTLYSLTGLCFTDLTATTLYSGGTFFTGQWYKFLSPQGKYRDKNMLSMTTQVSL